MSASSSGAVKALIEAAGLGVAVYRDRQPENEQLPYIVVHEAISIIPEPAFNQGDDPERHISEQVQIDLWERWKNEDGSLAESYTLGEEIAHVLQGGIFADPPAQVTRVQLIQGPNRFLEVEEGLVHKVYTVLLRRTLVPLGS
jgi:hypothetical protein